MPAILADHYHAWDLPGAVAWTAQDLTIPKIKAADGTETKKFYSLKADMAALRAAGAAKGIVDGGVVALSTKSTTLKRELWALKVGLGSSKKVLFTGCHHSREWVSVEMPFLVAHYLIENYTAKPTTDKEKRIHHLLHNREIWFVPMVNPDGHEHTLTVERGWRANRNSHVFAKDTTIVAPSYKGLRPARTIDVAAGTYTGVDVNRNYPTSDWGNETFFPKTDHATTSQDPSTAGANSVWCGPSAGSEDETKAISALNGQGFLANISYHNYGQYLLVTDQAVDAKDAYTMAVGEGMKAVINAHGGAQYTFGPPSTVLYAATGSQMDHFYEKAKRPSFTPEVRPGPKGQDAKGFSALPDAEIKPCFEENLGAALALINSAGFSAAPGSVKVKVDWQWPPVTVQAVQSCWNVFSKWAP